MYPKKVILLKTVYYVFLTLFLGIFFIRCYPLMIRTADDWRYLDYWRDYALALPGRGWNPGRILPEMLMPLAAQIGVYLIMPFIDSFAGAVASGMGIVLILFILIYLWTFGYMIRKNTECGIYRELLFVTLFLLFHFWIFRSRTFENTYMFDGLDANLYFFYVIPYMINFSVCFMWSTIREGSDISNCPLFFKALFLSAAYFAIFSNMYSSIVIAVYASMRCLRIYTGHKGMPVKQMISRLRYELAVIIVWVYSLIVEAFGGNAAYVTGKHGGNGILADIHDTVLEAWSLYRQTNKYFAVFSAFLLVVMVWGVIRRSYEPTKLIYPIVMLVVIWIYEILLSAIVGYGYISRTMVSATYLVILFILDIQGIIYILSVKQEAIIVMPLLIVVILSMINTTDTVFANPAGQVAQDKMLADYLVDEMVRAEAHGISEPVLHIPEWYSGGYDDDIELLSTYLPHTLWKYGVISWNWDVRFE
ncbi:MAG: hypothetical protein K5673_03670 [Lachnospiraceae bacterium]|nr:hypothetical protein [Lachnospiraceae bacterium]